MDPKNKLLAAALSAGVLLSSCAAPAPDPEPTPASRPSPALVEKTEEPLGFILPCYPAAGFHPITGTNRLNLTLAPLIYRGLFQVGRDFQAEKDLCESYTVSEDRLVWTFWLVEAIFSDGASLTSQEVADSLNAARRSERYGGRLKDVKRVAAEGKTVVVTLSQPNESLPLLLDIPVVKEGEDPLRPLGTGPYELTETEDGLALTARPGGKAPLDSIPLRTVEAGDDLVYAFDAQEISLVDTDLTGANALGYSGRLETTDYPTTTLLYIGCNLTSGPCRDQQVRQAVALAADRETIAEKTLAGHGVASPLPVHPNAPGYDAGLARKWGRNLERAKELLTEAGWALSEEGKLEQRRETLALRLIVNQDNTFKTAAAAELAADLEELGCQVTLDRLAWEDFTAALEKGEFDLYLGETALTADFDLEPLLGQNGALNYGGFGDGETWELMEKRRTAQGKVGETTFVNLCGRVTEQAPIVPLCFKNGSLLTQWGQVSGAEPAQRDVFAGIEKWTIRHS